MGMGPHQFDVVALNNTNADPRAKFPIGMPAASLDDAIRALMQSIALSREDHMGTLVVTVGSGNACTLTTNEGLIDPASTVGGGAPKITRPFSLRVKFSAPMTSMAAYPPTLSIDGAFPAPIGKSDGGPLSDGDISATRSYEIFGSGFTGGALSQIRVLESLPSEISATADARINAALPSIFASIGSPVQKAGDTMTGPLAISFVAPYFDLVYGNVLRSRQIVGSDGTWHLRNGDNGDDFLTVSTAGAVWTKQFGDLNTRIESRASAWADAKAQAYSNNCVQGARWVFAGAKSYFDQPGTGGFISPFGGQAMKCDYWSYSFLDANGVVQSAPFADRYRNLQVYIPSQGWVTVGAAS